jgi:hypothetical protein
MKFKSNRNYLDKIFISLLIIIFFTYNSGRLNYGLPYYLNLDETRFLYSTLSYLNFITGHKWFFGDPIIAPLFSLILILKSIFINEVLINSLTIDEIISKIYFNTELFIFYGRIASLITASLSIFFLYLIFKKLKIKFIIYSILLITFSTSLIIYHIGSYHGKHVYYLLLFLLQFYFYFKYSVKLKSFNIYAYIIFGLLGALAWGVSYWPAFFSIYFILILHFKKFKFKEIKFLITFFLIFFLLGPVLGIIVSDVPILSYMATSEQLITLEKNVFLENTINDILIGLKMILAAEKNILLLIIFFPLYFFNKYSKFKEETLVTLLVFFFPIILFAISQKAFPQLRYYVGNICIILICTSIILNELYKSKFKYLYFIFLISNSYLIYNNIYLNNKIDDTISNHSFFEFNKNIKNDKSKILYLVDLNFQESLKQNQLYLKIYNNDLIKKSDDYKSKISRTINKINKIKNKKNIIIENQNLKENIVYFNYSYHEINNLDTFFKIIKKDFDYVVIEETRSFYLTNHDMHKKIKKYVKNNFIFEQIYTKEKKIFLRSQSSIIHYYTNTINKFDYAQNIDNKNLDITFGSNYSLYKIR